MQEKKKPMYQVIVDDLKRKIRAGDFQPEEPFPTQIDLARLYDTSEITSRRALLELVNEGLIYRTRGKGTFLKLDQGGSVIPQSPNISKIFFLHQISKMEMFNHEFFENMFKGINEVCEENGIEFKMLYLTENFELPEGEDNGYIFLGHGGDNLKAMDWLRSWKEEGKKLITVHFYYPHLQIPYVIVDNLTGGYLATEHLLSLGHKRIGIILTGDSHIELNQEFSLRLQGYKLALAQHHIDLDPSLVCILPDEKEEEQSGIKGLNQLLDLANPPTAVFAGSDYKAFGAIQVAKDRNISIPEQLSIVGYDDLTVSQFISPCLTSVNQNSHKLGKRATEMLLFEWNNDNLKEEIVPTLMVRDSTKEQEID